MSHQQLGLTKTGPWFKVSSERPERRGINLAIPGLVVQCSSKILFLLFSKFTIYIYIETIN